MYKKIKDFIKDWNFESEATIKYLKVLTDESLNQKVTPDGRDLGFIAWHICTSIYEMLGQTGLPLNAKFDENLRPGSASELLKEYESGALLVSRAVEDNWDDGSLEDKLTLYGSEWTKSSVLLSLIRHQAHHRAQMSVIMRQAGLPVPGIYGPSKEEWSKFGMQAPA